MNMNKQTGLFQHDHRPSVSSSPSAPKWKRLPVPVSKYTVQEGVNLQLGQAGFDVIAAATAVTAIVTAVLQVCYN